MTDEVKPIVIVGAGLAGLTCARELHRAGRSFLLLDGADEVGGRIRTDVVDGFRLDRGFQVLLTAYPAAQKQFDYAQLNLKPYINGSLIRQANRFHRLADPWRSPLDGLRSAFGGVGSLMDKLRIAKLRSRSRRGTIGELFDQPETTTDAALKDYGFSADMIDSFFRPFLGGVFLERELNTSSRVLHFVFRMFSAGDVAVPALGMQELPKQIAADLPAGSIRLNAHVKAVTPDSVTLEDGASVAASRVVIGTNATAAASLLGQEAPGSTRRVRCLYFAAPAAPIQEPILVLNGDGTGPINNFCVPSLVSSDYAPAGQHLVSVSVVDPQHVASADLEAQVRTQAVEWFGADATASWRLIGDYDIPRSLPNQLSGSNAQLGHAREIDGCIVCGDHTGNASIQSALESGLDASKVALRTG
jgi:phytoene dehydrogenase-like protein